MESYRKSTGQGRLHSHSYHRISNLSSIVKRLASRSLTGQGLGIKVHQHYGFRLHLVWEWKRNIKNCSSRFSFRRPFRPSASADQKLYISKYCFERNLFTYFDVWLLCSELVTGGLEGLCSCVSCVSDVYPEDKVENCNRS
jgi:hypothetical protein